MQNIFNTGIDKRKARVIEKRGGVSCGLNFTYFLEACWFDFTLHVQ
jgi:hypothetical protein